MGSSSHRLQQRIARALVILIAMPLGEAVLPLAPPVQAEQTAEQTGQQAGQQTDAVPSTPAQAPAQASDQTAGQAPVQTPGAQTTTAPAAQSGSQQNGTTAPVGTAAAPYEKGIGVAASRPAGAVIAPAKQRRTRSFLIKVSVLLAAGVAIGTVVALSSASPSTPH